MSTIMTDTATDTVLSVDQWTPPLSNTEQLKQIKQSYPAYYRAWKTMINNGVSHVIMEWRGTIGLMRFIEDTSELPDNPTISTVAVKLKRKIQSLQYDKHNVYWKPSAVAVAVASISTVQPMQPMQPTSSNTSSIASITAIKEKYPTITDMEARIAELFELKFSGSTLSDQQELELEILGTLITGEEIPIKDKYTDL